MRPSQTSSRRDAGFTLIEVAVIAPIVILLIGVMVGYMVQLTSDSLVTQGRNTAVYETQAALTSIENDVSKAISFPQSTSGLQSGQGRNDGTTNFNNNDSDTLVLELIATDKSEFDATRQIVYEGSSPCNPANARFTYNVVYFVKSSDLYRRTIIPNSPARCITPFQKSSCTTTTPSACQIRDELLLTDSSLTKQFYDGSTTPINNDNSLSADNISVSLSTTRNIAGNDVTYSSELRIHGTNI